MAVLRGKKPAVQPGKPLLPMGDQVAADNRKKRLKEMKQLEEKYSLLMRFQTVSA